MKTSSFVVYLGSLVLPGGDEVRSVLGHLHVIDLRVEFMNLFVEVQFSGLQILVSKVSSLCIMSDSIPLHHTG